jgi:hypothetical protein
MQTYQGSGPAVGRKALALAVGLTLALAMMVMSAPRAEASTTRYSSWLSFSGKSCRAVAFINKDSLGYVYGQAGGRCTKGALHTVYATLQPLNGPQKSKVCSWGTLNCNTPFVSLPDRSGSQRWCLFAEVYWDASHIWYRSVTACAYY